MVIQVIGGFAEELLERLLAGFVVDSDALPCLGRLSAQDVDHLFAG